MNTDYSNEMQQFSQEPPAFDYLGMLWRRKWLLALGAIVGTGLGYLWYTKQPPVYQSSAEIQIVSPNATQSLPIEGFGAVASPLSDEMRVIRSELVLYKAAEEGQLSQTKQFSGMTSENIASLLAGGGALKLTPTNGNFGGTVITISYSCNDPEDSRLVVQSIIDAYAEHLRDIHGQVGLETKRYIKDASGEVYEKLARLESSYDEFRKSNLLIERDGTYTSVHRTNAEQLLAEIQKLNVDRTYLFGQYQAVQQAIDSEQEPAAVLIMLRRALDEGMSSFDRNRNAARRSLAGSPDEEINSMIPQGPRRSELMRQQQLFTLKLKEKELLSSFAPSHPALVSLRIQIDGMEQLISELEESERALDLAMRTELQKLQADAKKAEQENAENTLDPAVELDQQIQLRMLTIDQELKSLDQQILVLTKEYEMELAEARNEKKYEVEAAAFERDIARQRELYEKIVSRLDELEVASPEMDRRRIAELNKPKYGWQTAPTMSRHVLMGCFLGCLSAAGIGLLFEWSDKSYHGPEEISEHLKLPVIGHIPAVRPNMEKVRRTESELDPSLCAYFQPKSTFCEAYRAIRTALYFSSRKGDNKVIQVTSAVPSDGKSTVTANLAITIAQAGKSVLLVDCDFRRPRVHQLFKIDEKKGVAWMVEQMDEDDPTAGADRIGEAVCDTEIPNLHVMPCGERPANPAELLSSQKFENMLRLFRSKFDLVLVDSPPLLAVTDPSNIAARVDGVILVIRIRKVVRPMADRATRILETLGANVLGVVVNGVGSREAYGYGPKSYKNRSSYLGGEHYRSAYGYSYGNGYGVGEDYEYSEYYDDTTSEVPVASGK